MLDRITAAEITRTSNTPDHDLPASRDVSFHFDRDRKQWAMQLHAEPGQPCIFHDSLTALREILDWLGQLDRIH